MKMSRDFVSGFGSAVANLGSEGDHRGEDWSAPYEYLKDRLRAFEPVGNDIVERLRLRSREDCEAANEIERLRAALGQIAGKNDLSGVEVDSLEAHASAAFNALHECEILARAALGPAADEQSGDSK